MSTVNSSHSTKEALARSIVFHAASRAMRDALAKRRDVVPPRGMRGSGLPFVRDAEEPNGRRRNVISLDPIPKARAIRIGAHTFDKKHLKRLLTHNPGAKNPMTREPIPAWVRPRLGVLQDARQNMMRDLVRRVLRHRPTR